MAKIRSIVSQLPAAREAPRWYAYRTGYKREKRVLRRLTDRSIEAYLPLRLVVRRYASKTVTTEQPLFNGYVFARTTAANYASILADPDVFEVVQFRGEVGRVDDAEIAFLRTVLGDEREGFDARVHEGYLAGDPVVITGGTLAGTRGYIVGEQENRSFVVELRTLGVGVAMVVNEALIAPDRSPARARLAEERKPA